MAHESRILWFSPDPRGVLFLKEFHCPHGLRRALRKPGWEIRINTCFSEVMRQCAARPETWIDDCILASYEKLHSLGHAHSVETWKNGCLAGGLYGVALGGIFFGESMFHRETDASKVALAALVCLLRDAGYSLVDTQWNTSHLEQFGVREIPRNQYLRLLASALRQPCKFPTVCPLSTAEMAERLSPPSPASHASVSRGSGTA